MMASEVLDIATFVAPIRIARS